MHRQSSHEESPHQGSLTGAFRNTPRRPENPTPCTRGFACVKAPEIKSLRSEIGPSPPARLHPDLHHVDGRADGGLRRAGKLGGVRPRAAARVAARHLLPSETARRASPCSRAVLATICDTTRCPVAAQHRSVEERASRSLQLDHLFQGNFRGTKGSKEGRVDHRST